MKYADVKVGSKYVARISGQLALVEVIGQHEDVYGKRKFSVRRTTPGSKILFRSAAALRKSNTPATDTFEREREHLANLLQDGEISREEYATAIAGYDASRV